MADAINYVKQFRQELEQKYARELASGDLKDQGVKFIGAQTVNIPNIVMGGYKPHSRSGGFSSGNISHSYTPKTLAHDRSIEFFVDAMDVDETNQNLSAANITNTFEEEQAIPELDAYRFSKLYTDYKALADASSGAFSVDDTPLTVKNILLIFDSYMETMDDAGVPEDGRILYVTAAVNTIIKNAMGIYRTMGVQSGGDAVNRAISSLDNVKIRSVPSGRFKTKYVFTDGFVPHGDALQINMILVHPRSVIAVQKHSAIYLWAPGTHTKGDGYLYQNRRYGDLFIIEPKVAGIRMNVTSAGASAPTELDEPVAFGVTANGDDSNQPTTKITVTFGEAIEDLTAENFELEGEGADGVDITGVAAAGGGQNKVWELTVTTDVAVTGKTVKVVPDVTGYTFLSVADTVTVYAYGG